MKSVTADVISVRLRRAQQGFVHRVVDEYMDRYENGLLDESTTVVADQPMTMKEFGDFVVWASRLDFWCDAESHDTKKEAQEFVVATSEFYPAFGAFIAAAIGVNFAHEQEEDEEV